MNPGKLFHNARYFLIRVLEDSEDDLADTTYVKTPDPSQPASLKEIRDNHLFHMSIAINGLHVRIGRLEAKTGLILALAFGLLGLAARPILIGLF